MGLEFTLLNLLPHLLGSCELNPDNTVLYLDNMTNLLHNTHHNRHPIVHTRGWTRDIFVNQILIWSSSIGSAILQQQCVILDCVITLYFDQDIVAISWALRLIPGLCPANEKCCYKVTPSLIGWLQTWNQSWALCHWKQVTNLMTNRHNTISPPSIITSPLCQGGTLVYPTIEGGWPSSEHLMSQQTSVFHGPFSRKPHWELCHLRTDEVTIDTWTFNAPSEAR